MNKLVPEKPNWATVRQLRFRTVLHFRRELNSSLSPLPSIQTFISSRLMLYWAALQSYCTTRALVRARSSTLYSKI